MHVILHVLIEVPADPGFTPQQIRQSTREQVQAALSHAAIDIGTTLSVETSCDEDAPEDGGTGDGG